MRVGANYTPRSGWFHSWLAPDPDAWRRDLEALAGLGLDHVRVFPLWPLIQPSRDLISQRGLDDLSQLIETAAGAGLDVSVDVLNGHLSSFDFLPAWVSTWHRRNLFTDPDVVSAQVDLVRAVAGRVAEHRNGLGVCVGNEFPQFASPFHPERHDLTTEEAGAWLDRLLGAAREAMPDGHHVFSFDDQLWFTDAHPFTPELAVTRGDATTVHSWVFGGLGQHVGVDHPALATFARYLIDVANAYSPDTARPVWLQEVGAPVPYVTTERAPEFLRRTLEHCLDAPNLEAITWWCSHDVSRSLPDFPELEYSLGLIDADGRAKPQGRQLAELVPDLRRAAPGESERPAALADLPGPGRRSETGPASPTFAAWSASR